MRYFLDTNVLLDGFEEYCGEGGEKFLLSSETLIELEGLKTNRNKTEDVRAAARNVIRWLADNSDRYKVIHCNDRCINKIARMGYINRANEPDMRICACAWMVQADDGDVRFVTHDLSCRNIAADLFGLDVEWGKDWKPDDYKGFREIVFENDEDMAYFYEHNGENMYDLLVNEYLILRDKDGNVVDSYRWDGELYQPLYKKPVKSLYFDKIKPKDVYQSCVIDSIMNNTITAITGVAGCGKSLLSLSAIMALIENGRYDRFAVLFNPVKVRSVADLGWYGGDFLTKTFLNSVGNVLITKFGDRYALDLLLSQNRLKLVSMADCRGMEICDNEILYITEAANTTIDVMKLCLSRVSSGAKVIIEGDPLAQVDSYLYENKNNGLLRAIEAFKGHKEFGYVQLQNIWRSKIAELVERM